MANKTLRFKLIALCISLTTTLGVICLALMLNLVSTSKESFLKSFQAYSISLSDAIGAQFYERYGDVQAFTVNPIFQNGTKPQMVEALNTYAALYGIYDLIMYIDTKGNLIAANSKAPDGKDIKSEGLYKKNYATTSWFKAAMAGQFTEEKETGFSGTYFEDLHLDHIVSGVFGEQRYGNSFTAVVKNASGKVIGMINNRAGSRWVEVAFKETLESLKSQNLTSSQLSLFHQNGTLLLNLFPKTNKGSSEFTYDYDQLGSLNLNTVDSTHAKELLSDNDGSMVGPSFSNGITQLIGHANVAGKKFPKQVGWRVVVQVESDEILASLNHARTTFIAVFILITLGGALAAYFFASSLSKLLTRITENISKGADQVLNIARDIAESGTKISEATHEQSAALQETSSAVSEISAMVSKNADNAKSSETLARGSQEKTQQGKKSIEDVMDSMNKIKTSNEQVVTQVQKTNSDFEEVVKIIGEIGSKTKVIHDIVFQTKLLSFNASVEAARAGEHGKGFAVVAEEVGNLARMSGSAAEEIGSLLDKNTQKVKEIVEKSRNGIEGLIAQGKETVSEGTNRVQRCDETFTAILGDSSAVCSMMSEISTSSQEQSQGVQEVTLAIGQLDQATHENAALATKFASASRQMSEQATELQALVIELDAAVRGANAIAHAHEAPAGHSDSDESSGNDAYDSKKMAS